MLPSLVGARVALFEAVVPPVRTVVHAFVGNEIARLSMVHCHVPRLVYCTREHTTPEGYRASTRTHRANRC